MMRSFVIALVTIVLVVVAAPFERLTAQGRPAATQVPVDIVGGVPGVSIEVFMNNGKVADVSVGSAGDASWVLDMGNMGKTKVQIYVDVCKDGKIVKVMFVTGNGQPPPKDEDCDRRLVAAGFQSDCGVTRITLDIRNMGARVIGCGSMLTQPKVYGPVAGAVAVAIGLAAGGGGDTSSTTFAPTTNTATTPSTPTTSAPPPATPPSTTPAPTTPPSTTPPGNTTTNFTVTTSPTTNHPQGSNTSFICGIILTNPAQPGASWILTLTGPNVITAQSSGTLNGNGRAAFQNSIGSFGPYTLNVSVTSSGQTRTATTNHNVTSSSTACPSV